MSVVHFIVNQTPQPPYTGPYWSGVEQHPDFGGNMENPKIAIKQSGSSSRTILAGTPISYSTKCYFEIEIVTTGVVGDGCAVGIARKDDDTVQPSTDYSGVVGDANSGYATRPRNAADTNSSFFSGGSDIILGSGLEIAPKWNVASTTYTIGVAFYIDQIWISIDGVYYFYDGANPNPVTLADPVWTINVSGGRVFYPAVTLKENSITTATLKLTSAEVANLPSGYTALGDI